MYIKLGRSLKIKDIYHPNTPMYMRKPIYKVQSDLPSKTCIQSWLRCFGSGVRTVTRIRLLPAYHLLQFLLVFSTGLDHYCIHRVASVSPNRHGKEIV